jgi:tetratricopeptide (TPR) repeat protein
MLKYFFAFLISTLTTVAISAQPLPKAVPFYKSGQQFTAKGMFSEAIIAYKKAILTDKKYDSAYLALGTVFLKISMNDSAVAVLKRGIKVMPRFNDAHILLGVIYRDYIRNADEAIVHFLNAYQIDSTNKLVLYSLAWCYNDRSKFRDAIKYGVKALEVDNNYRPAYNELGHAYRSLQAYQEAIDQFKKNIAITPNEQPLYYSGLCYIELNDKAGAETMYEELKKINSKSADGLRKKIDSKQWQ